MRKAKLKYFEGISDKAMNNPRKVWKELNRLLGKGQRHTIERLKSEEGLLTDQKGIAEELSR